MTTLDYSCRSQTDRYCKRVVTDASSIIDHLRRCFPEFTTLACRRDVVESALLQTVSTHATGIFGPDTVRLALLALKKGQFKADWKGVVGCAFRAAFVLVAMVRCPELQLKSIAELLKEMPEGASDAELDRLLHFRNLMSCGIWLLGAKFNKGMLMHLAGRLSGKVYTTGGGASEETRIRERTYMLLGGVVKTPRRKQASPPPLLQKQKKKMKYRRAINYRKIDMVLMRVRHRMPLFPPQVTAVVEEEDTNDAATNEEDLIQKNETEEEEPVSWWCFDDAYTEDVLSCIMSL